VSDVIDRLLEVEKDARALLIDAEQQAAATLSKANQEARALRAEALEQGRRQADQFVKEQSDELQRQYEARLKQAEADLPTAKDLPPEEVRKIARFVVGVISAQEGEGER
jgi:vacuolar-type H+-ATPase subunit H